MAKASHDLGAPHDALTQARAAYACADNAGHDGLRAWVRGLQSLITYWSGRFDDSVRYAELGTEPANCTRGTAVAWLACAQARALGALNRMDEAHAAIARATDARESMQPDDLDGMGGICTFGHARQLYYSADALAWGGAEEAAETERLATEALDTYASGPRRIVPSATSTAPAAMSQLLVPPVASTKAPPKSLPPCSSCPRYRGSEVFARPSTTSGASWSGPHSRAASAVNCWARSRPLVRLAWPCPGSVTRHG